MRPNLVDYPAVVVPRPVHRLSKVAAGDGATATTRTYSGEVPLTHSHRPAAQSVTTAAQSRSEDQVHRLRQYLATMSVRTVCFVLAIVTEGWLRWVFAAAAILLPFIAVVAANAVAPRMRGRVRPVVPMRDETPQLTEQAHRDDPQG